MLQIDTLSKNKSLYNPNSEDLQRNYGIWDLTRSSITYSGVDVKFKKYVVIKNDDQMRPDLLAYRSFGDMNYTGSLLKINSISNPFAIAEGDVFAIPTPKSVDSMFSNKKTLRDESDRNPNSQFRDSQEQRKFKMSDSRKEFLSRRKNPVPQILPPNILQEGERQTVRTNSVIGLAPDVSNALPNPNANV
jgi:hypothetical protein